MENKEFDVYQLKGLRLVDAVRLARENGYYPRVLQKDTLITLEYKSGRVNLSTEDGVTCCYVSKG